MKTTLALRRQEWRRMHWPLPVCAILCLCPLQVHSATDPPEAPPSALLSPVEETEEVVELNPLTVTGTRIRGIDMETTLPVQRLTATDLDATGFSRFDEALRSLPMAMAPAGDGVDESISWAPGVSTVNLRGLLPEMTLVLVDGLRMAVHDGGGGEETPVNLFAIPSASIAGMEILRDGASAVYGSDAIAGVVNFRTLRDFRGSAINFGVGHAEGTGSGEFQGSIKHGQALSDRINFVLTLEYYERNNLAAREYAYMASTDYRDRGGYNHSSSRSYPAKFGVHEPGQPLFGQWVTYSETTSEPALEDLIITPLYDEFAEGNYFNYNAFLDYRGDTEHYGTYIHLDAQLSAQVEGFLDLFYQHTWTRTAAAPSPYDILESAVMPVENPFNPYGLSRTDEGTPMEVLYMRGRVVEAGRRITEADTEMPRLVAGFKGSAFRDWEWQLTGVWSESRSKNDGLNALRWDRLNEAMAGVDLNGNGEVAREEYFNPFGDNSDALVDHLRASGLEVGGDSVLVMLDGHASGTLWEDEHFKISSALGLELRREELDFRTSPLRKTELILGASSQADAEGKRNVTSAYGEVRASYRNTVTLHLAGRFENYSDFGQTTSPKVSTSWKVLPEVLIRGSYGEGFFAPSLTRLYRPLYETFVEAGINDPKRPGDRLYYGFWLAAGGNPKLGPSESLNRTYGLVLEPFARIGKRKGIWEQITGLTAGIEYSMIDLIDGFQAPGVNWLLEHEDKLKARYPGQGIVVERAPLEPDSSYPVGRVTRIVNRVANLEVLELRQYDLWLQWPISLGPWGDLNLRCDATIAESRKIEDDEYEGTYYRPRTRLTTQIGWSRGDWSTQWWFQYISGVPKATADIFGPDVIDYPTAGTSFRVNAQVSYTGIKRTRITIGARNLFNRDPPFDAHWSLGFHWQHPSEKRFWYARVERRF